MYKDLKFVLPIHPNPNVQKFKSMLVRAIWVNFDFDKIVSF